MKKNKIGIHKLLGFKTYYIPGQVAQLVGALPRAPKRVAGLIPGQGTYLGCGFDPQLGSIQEQLIDVSLSLTLKSINTFSSED